MSGSGKAPQVAYVQDEDEQGNPVRGSKHSARKNKERPKIRQNDSDRRKSSRKSLSDGGVVAKYEEAISPGTKSVEVVTDKLDRRKSSASSGKSPKKPTRPPSVHETRGLHRLSIPRKDDPSHFGIPTPTAVRTTPDMSQTQAIPIRPRPVTAQTFPPRPLSYHAAYTSGGYGTGPPLSASAYYQQPVTMPAPSYPPSPSPFQYRYAVTPQAQYSYFDTQPAAPVTTPVTAPVASRPLGARFEPIQRTTSAFGVRDPTPQTYATYDDDDDDGGYRSASEGPSTRRTSIRVPSVRSKIERNYDDTRSKIEMDYRDTRSKAEKDYQAMPPPRRPGILRRPATEYYADSAPDAPSYSDSRSVYRDDPPSTRRPSLRRNSVSYDLPGSDRVRVFETANNSRRRTSYYGPSNDSVGSSDYDAKMRQAQNYQENVAGPEPLPLTADALKRQQRRQAGSSRSTKSSGSRDESDYRKSATTRTTRSGSNGDDENVTIKVTGGTARVMVGGAQIDCRDGGEIEIKRQSIRNGSERGSEYGGTQRDRIEDRRSRVDRPVGRSRMSSMSNQSYTKTPQWI